jgi:hypothetical protein
MSFRVAAELRLARAPSKLGRYTRCKANVDKKFHVFCPIDHLSKNR